MHLLHTVHHQCTNSYYFYNGVSCPLISRFLLCQRNVPSKNRLASPYRSNRAGRGHEVRLVAFSQTCSAAFSPNDFSMLNLRCCITGTCWWLSAPTPVKCAYRSELGLTCHLMRSIGYHVLDFLQLQITLHSPIVDHNSRTRTQCSGSEFFGHSRSES